MPKITGPFWVWKRPKTKKFQITLYPASGLPPEICQEWQRRGFSRFPPELAIYRDPKTGAAAKTGALALIEYLKNQLKGPQEISVRPQTGGDLTVGKWLERFVSLDNNPRSDRLTGEGLPYSIETIELYRLKYNRYINGDQLLKVKMSEITQQDILEFMGRLGTKKTAKSHGDRPIAGTRTYEIAVRFVRMAFREYWQAHNTWQNPFDRIKAPKSKKGLEREVIEEAEIAKLFIPGVITDPLDKALCAAMFWAGMRRGEICGLKPEDLDWNTSQINIRNAWQRYDSPKDRSLGDPKWHKYRKIPFPLLLQTAIKELWAANGRHAFVFCRKNGKLPGANYMRRHLRRWLQAAGVSYEGRKIVPHSARHSLASALEAQGVPLRYIGDMLGHSNLKTTRGYLHTVSGAINDMGSKINEMAKGEKTEDEKTG